MTGSESGRIEEGLYMRRGEQAGTRIVDDADSLLQGGVYRYGLVHDWLRGGLVA